MAIKYSNEFKESIVSLSQTGRSANSLAKEYNVSVSTVTKLIIDPKMQHIVFYASFSMSYVFLYLIGLAQVISFLFYNLPKSEFKL